MTEMTRSRTVVFTVTNDLNFDQRMIRICTSLFENGFDVLLVGRTQNTSRPLTEKVFRQHRIRCRFEKGFLFYAEYNTKLLFFLFRLKFDSVCAIDLDTILPCFFVSLLRGKKRVYDAHELFCEMKEIVKRPGVYRCWKWIEKITVRRFKDGYTVNQPIADEFKQMYGVDYEVIRNFAIFRNEPIKPKTSRFILYQGAVNEGRSFETLIPAMKWVNASLVICGTGNFFEQAKLLAVSHGVADKIEFRGAVLPGELREITREAWVGITLFDSQGKSNYYSLANRFSDYLHAGIPQLCVDYPVYRELNNLYEVAVLIQDLSADTIARALNELLENDSLHQRLEENCLQARRVFCWQEEEKKLIRFYQKHFD